MPQPTYVTTSGTSLPLNKWKKLVVTVPADNSAVAFGASTEQAQIIWISAASTNDTKAVLFGPTNSCDLDSLLPGITYNIPVPHLQKISLADWFVKGQDGTELQLNVYYV